jgi:hypothetical protein
MTNLSTLQTRLQATVAELAELNRAIANNPESSALVSMTKSVERRQHALEEAFLREANGLGIDVCSYRLIGDDERPRALSVARALETFQSLVSNVYAAIKTGQPRSKGKISDAVMSETGFGFGYVYPGSLGVVLTLPNDRLLIGDTNLDVSMRTVFDMARADGAGDIVGYADTLGPAAVRALYRWSFAHGAAGLGADIEWRRELDVHAELFLQAPELDRLANAIAQTGDPVSEEVTILGKLVGIDTARRTFHFTFENQPDIKGTLAEGVSPEDNPALVPALYTANLTKTTRPRYAVDEDEVKWVLNSLHLGS